MDYQEFRCGGGMPLAYASWCPQCNPDSSQWEDECLRTYQMVDIVVADANRPSNLRDWNITE